MKTTNSATATYDGLGKSGKGHVKTKSGALDHPYGFNTRFEDKPGTNPEEMIAAAHASCFTMALSIQLGNAGFEDGHLETTAKVTLEDDPDGGFRISKSALTLTGKVAEADQAKFEELAKKAKEGCPISKLLDCEITLETNFQG
ncbi:OsmC family protein [Erythrobacter sp. LQ02-29]|uniref:OsmC family protein n=1 Tax=Erythrobacter sp. LQ02-29 TaxID=2920384 RepID=UPI001F4DCF30|nr:OsmC family protein [Erythrobacter sp. LQ02-29]MCP9221692.1 OsmC family protein [Erythrobacter sp. LQ02-29]